MMVKNHYLPCYCRPLKSCMSIFVQNGVEVSIYHKLSQVIYSLALSMLLSLSLTGYVMWTPSVRN